mmetsp:Transcript_31412/g.96587  ORF Transcript_31412/g.96587 Transcript_31412/m.96587 type:complete len:225 (-) Transcript_31412:93-767(-)
MGASASQAGGGLGCCQGQDASSSSFRGGCNIGHAASFTEVVAPLQDQLDRALEELWEAQQALAEERAHREEAMDALTEALHARQAEGERQQLELGEERTAREEALLALRREGDLQRSELVLAHQALQEERASREKSISQLVDLLRKQVAEGETEFQALRSKVATLEAVPHAVAQSAFKTNSRDRGWAAGVRSSSPGPLPENCNLATTAAERGRRVELENGNLRL